MTDIISSTPPAVDDDRELLIRWHVHRDVLAREELVARMLPLARSLARRYAGKGEPLDDLEQVACVGLLKAIDRFDVGREVKFSTFAVPTIAGELKRHFRDRGWMLRVPRDVQELSGRLTGVRETLTNDLGRAPTVTELAQATNADEEQVLEALSAGDAYRTLSLDEPLVDGAGAHEAIGGPDEGFEQAEHRVVLRDGLVELAPRERLILRLRYVEGLTQREIAGEVGISQMHVSRLLRRSVDELRERLTMPQAA
ncbi:SigB/SigF/SigG family RNA polymerase sigma factor [Conexibacter sp. SYSU D00693]|uniref:SigB/SigF/SigG family RNA polymerase sigma factor n=1 Tax=Conexibacter sp. SYSU D00693 TaxID=2812560 RepID=UPI001F120CB9|nr:SigB/SigF/SigG family RNA polymerase sigma factor [Conexibacter sp. SYSU D00693]